MAESDKDLRQLDTSACGPAYGRGAEIDPDLAKIIGAWTRLPETMRKTILGIVAAATG